MTEKVLRILKEENITEYSLFREEKQSVELFFIKKNIDLSRAKKVEKIVLTVYRDYTDSEGKKRGQSQVFIYPNTSLEGIRRLVKEAYESALYVKNPFFNIPEAVKDRVMKNDKTDLSRAVIKMAEALYGADNEEEAFVNSSEFFAELSIINILNSKGLDVTYDRLSIEGEFVVQSLENDNDVELHTQFEYDRLNETALAEKCRDALKTVRDRAYAVKAPEDLSGLRVIICDANAGELMNFYLTRADASQIYPGYSDFKKESSVCEEAPDRILDITMVPDAPYSLEGVAKKEHALLKDGIVKNIHGSVRFLDYINEPQIGTYNKIRCSGNEIPLEKIKEKPYILIKNFSDFQMDAMDGHFGGEFRLAYLFDGEKETIVTGGTINGNIFEAQKSFLYSKEQYKDANYEGPAAIAFD